MGRGEGANPKDRDGASITNPFLTAPAQSRDVGQLVERKGMARERG